MSDKQTTTETKIAPHVLITPKDCGCNPEVGNCPICDGGLAVCKVCGKAEVDLDEPCIAPDRAPADT